jgi:predicted Rdx family selenoprotein
MSDDDFKQCGVVREDRPIFVWACLRCGCVVRSNQMRQEYCDDCEWQMCTRWLHVEAVED